MSSPEYNLYYFDIRGLAEPIRYILSYGGANWKDHRLPYTCFGKAEIPEEFKSRCPYGSVPVLEFEGKSLAQSAAIGRYLAQQYDLVGKNELEAARCDEVVDAVKDFMALWMPAWKAEDKMLELVAEIAPVAKDRFLSKFNQMIKERGGFIVGKKITWADIWVAHNVSNVQLACPNVPLLEEFPALRLLITTVFNEPKIKEWIDKRPNTLF